MIIFYLVYLIVEDCVAKNSILRHIKFVTDILKFPRQLFEIMPTIHMDKHLDGAWGIYGLINKKVFFRNASKEG